MQTGSYGRKQVSADVGGAFASGRLLMRWIVPPASVSYGQVEAGPRSTSMRSRP